MNYFNLNISSERKARMAANKFGYEQTEYRKTPYSFIVIEKLPPLPIFFLILVSSGPFSISKHLSGKLHFESYFRFPRSHKSV